MDARLLAEDGCGLTRGGTRVSVPPHYTTGQIAELFGLSYNGARLILERGSIASFRVPGSKHRRISRSSLIAYLGSLRPEEAQLVLARLEALDVAIAERADERRVRRVRKD
jgi:excisionase family DNA binding protein